MKVKVESMYMTFIMFGLNHVGLDFLFQKLQQMLQQFCCLNYN